MEVTITPKQKVLSQQVSVVPVAEPCLCLSHHFFQAPLWVPAGSVRTPGSREKRTFVNSLWVVQMACKHMYLCKDSIFFRIEMGKKRQKLNDTDGPTRNPWYTITFISWQRGFGRIQCFMPKWPEQKSHPSNKNTLPCIIPDSCLQFFIKYFSSVAEFCFFLSL